MDNKICYLNTDLDLTSPAELTDLANAFETMDFRALHVTKCDDGEWIATFETDESYSEPETSISAMLTAIESFSPTIRLTWDGCIRREFNIGYDCGAEPWEFNQGLSNDLLRQIAAVGASIRITLYPDRPTRTTPP